MNRRLTDLKSDLMYSFAARGAENLGHNTSHEVKLP